MDVPQNVVNFIAKYTSQYGQAKLILKENRYFIECTREDILEKISNLPNVSHAHHKIAYGKDTQSKNTTLQAQKDGEEHKFMITSGGGRIEIKDKDAGRSDHFKRLKKEFKSLFEVDEDMEDEESKNKNRGLILEVHPEDIEKVRGECLDNNFPLLEEYDFKRDSKSPTLPIELDTITKVRPYQEMALSKMFSQARARSGVIVLP